MKVVLALLLTVMLMAASGCQGGFFMTRRAAFFETPAPKAAATPAASSEAGEALPRSTPLRSPIPIDRLSYEAPDLGALEAALNALLADIDAGNTESSALMGRYDQVLTMYDKADAASQIAYLLYAGDVTDSVYWDEYSRITETLLILDLDMTDVSVSLFDSSEEAERLARARYGDGFVDAVYAEESLSDESVIDLMTADNELQGEYDALLTTFCVTVDGKSWTFDDIIADSTLSYGEYIGLYERYCEALNAEAGALFIEMLALRADIASRLGFGNYAAYRYACYGRDYTIIEAQAFHAAVKEYLVPVFISAFERSDDVYDLYDASFERGQFLISLAAAVSERSLPRETLQFLTDNDLCDFAASEKKMESSFTIYISSLQTPYIFMQWEDDSYSVGTLLHEFGHFINYYCNPEAGWSSGDSLDLAEIDSQAFVLMMFPYYDRLFGAEYGEQAKTDQLLDALYAIVSGSMEDEFQQRVYADPGMTLEEMNALYAQLAVVYGMDEVYGFTGTEWTLIPHSFQSPMYYISYAVSMLAALQIWEKMALDEDAAWDCYTRILMREPYAAFRSTLADAGLSDPLSAYTVKRMAELIDANIP